MFKKIHKIVAFTLIELLVVIAIISILAAILLIALNPGQIFINARNSGRATDVQTIQNAFNRYLSDGSISAVSRSLTDFPGYSTLLTNATASNPSGNCPNGSTNIVNTTINGAYNLDTTGSSLFNITLLINGGYLSKVVKDPSSLSDYQACIDTVNGNALVIFAPVYEGKAINYSSIVGSVIPSVPLALGGLSFWIDASQISGLSDGQVISQWNDISGNGLNMIETGSARPTYKVNVVNSHPSIRFSGANQHLYSTSTVVSSNSNTIVFVARANNSTTSMNFMDGGTGGRTIVWRASSTGAINMYAASTTISGSTDIGNNFVLVSVVSSGGTSNIYVNGALYLTGNPGSSGIGQMYIGQQFDGPNPLNGDIAEMLLYNRALSASDLAKIQTYLDAKYTIY